MQRSLMIMMMMMMMMMMISGRLLQESPVQAKIMVKK